MFQCPKCKKSNLIIRHLVRCVTNVNRNEEAVFSEQQDLEWGDDDSADCDDCGWDGTVKDISIEEYEEAEEGA